MKKITAMLTALGMLTCMISPVFAEEETITTFKGDQEIVLTPAGAVDITMEELVEKSQTAMKDLGDTALHMKMDIDASISADMEGTPFTMDLVMKGDMLDNKFGGVEYKTQDMTMSFFGMDMSTVSEEYIFTNAGGIEVSVKKETSEGAGDLFGAGTEDADSSAGSEEADPEWVAQAVGEEADDAENTEETEVTEAVTEDTDMLDSVGSDDFFSSFELLDSMYTDGEKNYYVLKGNTADVMSGELGGMEDMLSGIDADTFCYMLLNEDAVLESLYMDLGSVQGIADEASGAEMSFSSFLVSIYTEDPAEITIPEEVQAAGDAVV